MSTKRVQVMASEPKYRDSRIWVSPYYDHVLQEFEVGGKRYKAETPANPTDEYSYICKETPIIITDTFQRQIQAGDSFDPDDEKAMFVLQMGIDRGAIAKDKASVNESQHMFYLKDEQREAEERSTKADKVYAAMGLVRKMSLKKKTDLCFYLGQPAREMSEEMIDAHVKEMAMNDPMQVMGLLKSDNWEVRAFIRRAVMYGVITTEGPVHKLGSMAIGIDEDATVAYMLDKSNAEVVKQIKERTSEGELEEDNADK